MNRHTADRIGTVALLLTLFLVGFMVVAPSTEPGAMLEGIAQLVG